MTKKIMTKKITNLSGRELDKETANDLFADIVRKHFLEVRMSRILQSFRAERIEEAARAVTESLYPSDEQAIHVGSLAAALSLPPDPPADAKLRELRKELAAELKRVQRHPIGNRGLAWVIEKIDRLLAAPDGEPKCRHCGHDANTHRAADGGGCPGDFAEGDLCNKPMIDTDPSTLDEKLEWLRKRGFIVLSIGDDNETSARFMQWNADVEDILVVGTDIHEATARLVVAVKEAMGDG